MHKDEQNPEQRHQSLLALYDEAWEEIRRLREFEWKIAVTFVSLSGGFVVLICSDSFKPLLTHQLRWILTIVQVCAIVFGIYSLWRTHEYLTVQRNIRRTIESVLNFHEDGVFSQDPLLPSLWKDKPVTFGFQALGLLVPLVLIVVFVQALAIYITWVVPAPPREKSRHRSICSNELIHIERLRPESS
jgi:hypothetical protein